MEAAAGRRVWWARAKGWASGSRARHLVVVSGRGALLTKLFPVLALSRGSDFPFLAIATRGKPAPDCCLDVAFFFERCYMYDDFTSDTHAVWVRAWAEAYPVPTEQFCLIAFAQAWVGLWKGPSKRHR